MNHLFRQSVILLIVWADGINVSAELTYMDTGQRTHRTHRRVYLNRLF